MTRKHWSRSNMSEYSFSTALRLCYKQGLRISRASYGLRKTDKDITSKVLILAGTYFRGNRIDHISCVFIFPDLLLKR